MTEAPMPADPVVALLPVTQDDVAAANALDDALGFLTDLERPIVEQAFARHRLDHRTATPTPDSSAVSGSAEGLREAERICRETADRATHQLDREDRRWQPTRAHYEGLRNALRNAERQLTAHLTEGQRMRDWVSASIKKDPTA